MSAVEAVEQRRPLPAGSSPELVLQGLYERHSERIFGFCLRRLRTRPEAEDAVQTTFLQAFRALQRGVVPLCEHAWLFKIAENVCLSTHRSNGRRREHELGHDPEAVDSLAAGEVDSDTARELRRALAALPDTQRQALLMREWRGMSYREIATQLGTSVAAVETLIFRARRGVARMLGESGIKSRLAGVLNLGSLVGSLKAALGGATAVKLAAAAAVLAVAALPAGDSRRATPAEAAAAVEAASIGERGGAATGNARALTSDGRPVAAGQSQGGTRSERPGAGQTTIPGSRPGGPVQQGGQPLDGEQPAGGPPSGAAGTAPGTTPPGLSVAPSVPGTPGLPAPPSLQPPPALPPVEAPPLPPLPQVPPLPQLPAVPQPELPKPPELPKTPELPAVPEAPKLPVKPPELDEPLPELPKLP